MVNKMTSCIGGQNLVNTKGDARKILHKVLNQSEGKYIKSYPNARWKHAAVVYKNRLYMMGGCGCIAILKDLWCLNLGAFTEAVHDQMSINGFWNHFPMPDNVCELWQDLSNFVGHIPPLQSHSMVAYNNQLYIFGGTFVYDVRDCPLWIYSIEYQTMRKWKGVKNEELPSPRRNHSCSIYKDTMLLFGGFGDVRGSFGDLWAFDLKAEKWRILWCSQKSSRADPLSFTVTGPCPRHDHSAVIHSHCLWIYGGMFGLDECSDLWQWNIEQCQWTKIYFKVGPMDLRCINHVVIRHNWIFYGVAESKKRAEKWKFCFRSSKWTLDYVNGQEFPPHSTICLTKNGGDKSYSQTNGARLSARRNKVHPMTDHKLDSTESAEFICLKTCSIIDSVKISEARMLSPVDIVERYTYNNSEYLSELETTFTENIDETVTVITPKLKDYVLLLGNGADKGSFESSIGIYFSLLP